MEKICHHSLKGKLVNRSHGYLGVPLENDIKLPSRLEDIIYLVLQ
jgi:hypothetical protein